MKITWILCLGVLFSQSTFAEQLTQSQYDIKVKQFYNALETKQADLNRALDKRDSLDSILKKSCEYATYMRNLEKLSLENIHLRKAQDEVNFIRGLIQNFDQSLADLGTTYNRSCKR